MHAQTWWRIGWRNLWRSRRRTAITAGALALGFLAATVMIGLSEGIVAQMIENGTELVTGQVQAHDAGYKPERSLYHTIGGQRGVDVERLIGLVARHPDVDGATPRVYAGGLVSSGSETSAAILLGVDLDREPGVSRILEGLREGRLPRRGGERCCWAANWLARSLSSRGPSWFSSLEPPTAPWGTIYIP